MKKLLIAIGVLIIFCSGAAYFADLPVNGSIIKTDPTFTGTLKIYNSANNEFAFNSSAIGDFFIIKVGNSISTGNQTLTSTVRGIQVSSSIANVAAIESDYGNVLLNYGSGLTLVGPGVVNDGFSRIQVKGSVRTDSLRGIGGVTGDVLTKNAAGYWVAQAPTGGVNIYNSNGVLTGTRNVTGAFQLNFGTVGSPIGGFVVASTGAIQIGNNQANIALGGGLQYNTSGTADVNYTVSLTSDYIIDLVAITTNRTITLTNVAVTGKVLKFANFNASSNSWLFGSVVKTPSGLTVSGPANGATTEITYMGATRGWIKTN